MTTHSTPSARPVSTRALTPLVAALAMAVRGCFGLPLWWPTTTRDGRRRCACPKGLDCPPQSRAKHPINVGWQQEATTDAATIRGWFGRWPDMNYGIFLGPSRLIVLDEDDHDGTGAGREAIGRLEALAGPLPRTWCIATGGGGRHWYFDAPPDFDWHTEQLVGNLSVLGLGPGVDVKYGGGLVVGVGSWHISGRQYVPLMGLDGVLPWE